MDNKEFLELTKDAIITLMDEVTGKCAARWGPPNDALIEIEKRLAQPRHTSESLDKNIEFVRNQESTSGTATEPDESPVPPKEPGWWGKAIDEALDLINRYGGIDGDHHKQWVLDQIIRCLTNEDYGLWVLEHNQGEDGPNTYEWDEGIAP